MSDAFRVALTLDAEHPDRPHHGAHAGWVLDEIRRLDVRATVFLQGRWVEAFPDLARRVADEGHLVGNHSFYHARMPLLSMAGFEEDVREAERVIREVTGKDPRPWLRFPFGAGADAADVVGRLQSPADQNHATTETRHKEVPVRNKKTNETTTTKKTVRPWLVDVSLDHLR